MKYGFPRSIKSGLRHIIFLLLLELTGGILFGQNIGLYFGVGGGTYRMDDLKYYQHYLLSSFPIEGKMISLFPPYVTGSAGIERAANDFMRFGIDYSFMSSGAKSHYSDYSGYRESNQVIKTHQFSAYFNYKITGGEMMELLTFTSISASYTILTISESIYATSTYYGSYYDAYYADFTTFSPQLAAGLTGIIKFTHFDVGLDALYQLDIVNDLVSKENSKITLKDPEDPDRNLSADWSGFRLRLKMIIWLN